MLPCAPQAFTAMSVDGKNISSPNAYGTAGDYCFLSCLFGRPGLRPSRSIALAARPSRHASRPSGLRSLPHPIVPFVGGSRSRGPPSAALCCRSCGCPVEPISGPRMGALICPAARAHTLSFFVASFPYPIRLSRARARGGQGDPLRGRPAADLDRRGRARRRNYVGSGGNVALSHQGKRPGPGSPLSVGISRLQKRYNRCGRNLSRRSWSDRAGGERGVR
jgi:hypothetical protein